MTMTANGLAKLIEECGELLQVAGKRLAYYHTNVHPDGGKPLDERIEDEIADVMAACRFYVQTALLDASRIADRSARKVEKFRYWHEQRDNNTDAIDGAALETGTAPNTKGSFGAECNRSSCKNVPATWKHRDLHNRYYCQTCGPWINEQNGEQLCSAVNRGVK